LLGWVTFELDGTLRLDGIALRRTLAGDVRLSDPQRVDRQGREHPYIRPVDDAARREVERQVLQALRVAGRVPA
jgi:hypothetical protein